MFFKVFLLIELTRFFIVNTLYLSITVYLLAWRKTGTDKKSFQVTEKFFLLAQVENPFHIKESSMSQKNPFDCTIYRISLKFTVT